jgi:hypothetical protein
VRKPPLYPSDSTDGTANGLRTVLVRFGAKLAAMRPFLTLYGKLFMRV